MDNNIPASIVRQPPLPPAARLIKGNIKQPEPEPEPEMVVGNSGSTRTYYPRSCKRKRLTDIDSLPDEMLFEILVRLPAQDIYNPARLVCSKWHRMIHTHTFIYAHLHHSTYGLLFQSMLDEDSFFMAVGESGRVEISKHRYKIRRPTERTSCNGLLLDFQTLNNDNLCFYVSNPATRQIFHLPPFARYITIYDLYGIAYAAASMEYKAVVLACPRLSKKKLFILTIGVDNSWRTVGTDCSSLATTQVFTKAPLITEGFAHWYHITSNEVLTLNVETEIITSCPIPRVACGDRHNVYLSTGRYVSLLVPCGELCWEAWEMKPKIDYQWRKVWDVSLEAHKCSTFRRIKQYKFVIPIGWLKYQELLAFRVIGILSLIFVFNLLTQEIDTIELPSAWVHYFPVVHKNSLVWLGGC